MYNERQQQRIIGKLVRFEETLERLTFTKIDELSMKKYQTIEPFDTIPDDHLFTPCNKGEQWGGEVRFETLMNWQEEHRFLKTVFDTTIFTDVARQEVQFGYIKRPTTRNDSFEKAKFEVSNHKYTSLSETRYGAAVLNDCKYGISVENSSKNDCTVVAP